MTTRYQYSNNAMKNIILLRATGFVDHAQCDTDNNTENNNRIKSVAW